MGHAGNAFSGFYENIKTVDGLVFSDNGKVVSAATLAPLGSFSSVPSASVVEPMPGTNIVYFLGSASIGGGYLQLVVFDKTRFLQIDSKTFTNVIANSVRSLVSAGKEPSGGNRLGYVQRDGTAGIISITPPAFKIQSFLSNGSVSQLTWPSDVGRQYFVQWSSNLVNWTTFITTTATQPLTTKTFNSQGTLSREFYRVTPN